MGTQIYYDNDQEAIPYSHATWLFLHELGDKADFEYTATVFEPPNGKYFRAKASEIVNALDNLIGMPDESVAKLLHDDRYCDEYGLYSMNEYFRPVYREMKLEILANYALDDYVELQRI